MTKTIINSINVNPPLDFLSVIETYPLCPYLIKLAKHSRAHHHATDKWPVTGDQRYAEPAIVE
jgi:hypothetical protein